MNRRPLRPVPAIILAVWVVMMGLLVKREYSTADPLWLPEMAQPDTGMVEWWTGIYIGGEKIGYAHNRRTSQGDSLFRLFGTQLLRLNTLGQTQVVNLRSMATLNRDFSLRSFSFAMNSDNAASSLTAPSRSTIGGTSFEVQGGVDGNRLRINVNQGKGREDLEQIIPTGGPIYIDAGLSLLLGRGGFEVGEELNVPTFDPATLTSVPSRIRVVALDTVNIHGRRLPAYRLETEYMGFTARVWVDDAGIEIRGEVPLGTISMMTLRESREQALNEGWDESTALDLVNLAAIPAGVMKIEGARMTDSMRVRLSGIDPAEFDLTFGRQELIERIVVVRKESISDLEDFNLPNENRAHRNYLRSTPFIQSEDEIIIEHARSIRGDNRSALGFTRQLVHWVYDYLGKVPTAGMPSAIEVLGRKAGDCNEHTVLFTALARAAGLPAMMNAGVVYLDGRFYYHAWPSVWLGKWVAVDPTFDQFPADATHISFVRGGLDRQVELMNVLGRLSIEVVSYHPLPEELKP